VQLPGDARRQITPRFALVDTRHPGFMRVTLEESRGWYPEEYAPRGGERWRWTHGDAALIVNNPHDYPLALECTLDGWSVQERTVRLVRPGGEVPAAAVIGATRGLVSFPVVTVPPGTSRVMLESPEPPAVVPGDPRPLGISVFRLVVAPRQ
jgi:hypothetical protein